MRILKIDFGKNMQVYQRIYLNRTIGSSIFIGRNFTFTSGGCFNPLSRNILGCLCTEKGAMIRIGNNVGISSACIWAHNKIIIGNNVKIGGDCIVLDSDAHSLDYIKRRYPQQDVENKRDACIVIEDDVLIGARCIVLKGVRIGARSVIGAGSVVIKDIPSDCIAGGNPCRIIRKI